MAATSSSLPLSQGLFPSFPRGLAPFNGPASPSLRAKRGIGGSLLWGGRGTGESDWSLLGEETNLHLSSGVPNSCHWRLIPWPQEVKGAKVPQAPPRGERRKGKRRMLSGLEGS